MKGRCFIFEIVTNMKYFATFLILLSALATGCQQEESIVQQAPAGLTASSALGTLLSRVSQNPTAMDNILDNSSCFGVNLPVTVLANGQQLTITDDSGYQAVAEIFAQSASDEDTVEFIYPITVTFQNFQQQSVASAAQMQSLMVQCGTDDGLDEIACVAIQYPVTINTYDTLNQQAGNTTVNSNAQLFNFLVSASNMVLEVVYPISVSISGGTAIPVNGNTELADLIEGAIGTCGSGGPGPAPLDELAEILTGGSWYVSYYYHNEDETGDYAGYVFTFSANGTVAAVKNGNTYSGSWNAHLEGSTQFLDIDFSSSNLGDLDDDWRVLEFSEQTVRLRQDGGGNDPDRLHFSKI